MTKKNDLHSLKNIHQRYSLIFYIFVLLGFLVILKIFYIQTFRKKRLLKYDYSITTDKIYGLRGDILSRDGKPLATTSITYDIYYDPNTEYLKAHDSLFYSNLDSISRGLSQILGDRTPGQYKEYLLKARQQGIEYLPIKKNVTVEQYRRLKKLPVLRLSRYKGGLIAQEHYQRIKPYGKLASRTIGEFYYNSTRRIVGIERAYNEQLSGVPGIAKYKAITGAKRLVYRVIIPPEDGADVMTSLDMNLQNYVESALEQQLRNIQAQWGCAIVMDVKSGQVLAMANLQQSQTDSSKYYESYNYAIAHLYEVGSVMKPFSMLALFEFRPDVTLNEPVNVNTLHLHLDKNIVVSDDFKRPLGYTTLLNVVAHSSNIGVIKVIQKYFYNHQYDFINRLVDLGLSKKTGFEIPGEHPMELKDPEQKRWWKLVSLSMLSIGYEYQMTPIEVLSIYNAIANNGLYVTPHIGIATIKNGQVKKLIYGNSHYIASQKSIKKVQKMLEAVVKYGTASHTVKSDLVKIAGKTGTAKIFDRKLKRYIQQYNTTFVGYFPADNPKYSMIVVIHKPQKYGHRTGATASGPVFKKVAEYLYKNDPSLHKKQSYDVELFAKKDQLPDIKFGRKDYIIDVLNHFNIFFKKQYHSQAYFVRAFPENKAITLYKISIPRGYVPDVRGMSAEDATYILENLGLKVKINGRGRVFQQSILPKTKLQKGQTIVLTLR